MNQKPPENFRGPELALESRFSVWNFVHDALYLIPVILEGQTTLLREGQHSLWFATHKVFLDIDVARFFQFAHVRGKVAPGELGLVEQESEIGAFQYIEIGHDGQACCAVDERIQIFDGSQLVVLCGFTHVPLPFEGWGAHAGSRQAAKVQE